MAWAAWGAKWRSCVTAPVPSRSSGFWGCGSSLKGRGGAGYHRSFRPDFFAVGQITSGAKVFAAVTGSNSYYLGILLTIVITVIYTVSGGSSPWPRWPAFKVSSC